MRVGESRRRLIGAVTPFASCSPSSTDTRNSFKVVHARSKSGRAKLGLSLQRMRGGKETLLPPPPSSPSDPPPVDMLNFLRRHPAGRVLIEVFDWCVLFPSRLCPRLSDKTVGVVWSVGGHLADGPRLCSFSFLPFRQVPLPSPSGRTQTPPKARPEHPHLCVALLLLQIPRPVR